MGSASQQENNGIHSGNHPGIPGNVRVISYNIPEGERPDGIKVRHKIRVITGKRAKETDARQARAILEVLQWLSRHQPPAR